MIIPTEDHSLLHLYSCGVCKKIYCKRTGPSSCSVLHPPGSCCHHGDQEIPRSTFRKIIAYFNHIVMKED